MIDFLAAGTCSRCAAPLAPAQRYCISCGERRGELNTPFRPPERAPVVPVSVAVVPVAMRGRRSIGAVGTVVLASGVLIGAAIGPAITPSSFASAAGQVLLVTTGPAGAGASGAGGVQPAGQLASSGGQLGAPTGNVAKPPPRVVNQGGNSPAPSNVGAAANPPPVTTPPPTTPPPPPPPPPADTRVFITGTVVHLSHSGHDYAIATKEGQLIALHTAKAPKVGDRVKTEVKPLANGTFKAKKPKVKGHVERAKFHGTVTYSEPDGTAYTVSGHGVSLLVHLPPADPAAPPRQPPVVGAPTEVEVAMKPVPPPPPPPPPDAAAAPAQPSPDARQLEEVSRKDAAPSPADLDVEAIVRAISPDHTQLTLSADDAGESPSTFVVRVPNNVDVSKLAPDAIVSATIHRESDGTLTLVVVTDDSGTRVADGKARKPARRANP